MGLSAENALSLANKSDDKVPNTRILNLDWAEAALQHHMQRPSSAYNR